jgi:ABC-type glycerol-3-phosphate transport system substrate-binding protein
VRGVPAAVYDEGRSIELYSGRVAIDLFSDSFAHAYAAAQALLPLNAPGTASGALPPPIYCPGLSGPQNAQVKGAMAHLPGQACQKASAALAFADTLS